nr:elongation factor P maturation arginine rhamnosyltransferase EarP [Treponema sp.]
MDITILCKVVDNFGDIGVVYRLARAIEDVKSKFEQVSSINMRIVVDNLRAFANIVPGIDVNADVQQFGKWQIFLWDSERCLEEFEKKPPEVILECFQCGRPDWLDELLFVKKVPNVVNIFMIDYLTAEDYAETFHCLQSLTRSSRVQKVNFMPGFTSKTGGLILDGAFVASLEKVKSARENYSGDSDKSDKSGDALEILYFSYPKDLVPVVKAFETFENRFGKKVKVLLAKGAGRDCFVSSWTECGKKIALEELDFIPQEEWDYLLCKTPLLFIRGEDSLARACLAGNPFVWHAYPQSEDYQLVKVGALLNQMKPFFSEEMFCIVEKCWNIYNGTDGDLESAVLEFLLNYENLKDGFEKFASNLKKNGDLAFHLMTFILKTCMIE